MTTNRTYLALGGLLLLLLAFLYFTRPTSEQYNWTETYAPDSRQPYATGVLRKLVDSHFDEVIAIDKDLAGELPVDSLRVSGYFFAGEGLYFDTADTRVLLEFVEAGNIAFISSKTLPQDLLYEVYNGECDDVFWEDYTYDVPDTTATLELSDGALTVTYRFVKRDKAVPYKWHYAEPYLFCDYAFSIEALGVYADSRQVNFFGIRYGAGTFFLHSTPLVFTNYHLRDSLGLTYANRLIDYLPADGPLYFDEASGVRESVARSRNRETPRLDAESPLRYVLAQPALAWAWYILLAMGVLYLIFRARRRQRAIPILERNENTSLAFIETIGRLTFARGNHAQLAEQKMRTLLTDVRERYQLPARELDADFEAQLAHRAEVPPDLVHRLVQLYRNIRNSSYTSDKTLEDFHRLIQTFHQHRKA